MARLHGDLTTLIACIAIAVRVVTASASAHGHSPTAAPHSPTAAPHGPTTLPHVPTHAPHGPMTTPPAGHGPASAPHGTPTQAPGHGLTHAPHGPTHAPGHGPTHAPHGPTHAPGHGPTHAPHGPTHAPGHGPALHAGHGTGHGAHGGHAGNGTHGGGHGSHGGHGGHHTLAVDDLEDVLLFTGGLLFFSFLFYMTNKKFARPATVRFTWNWISTTLSIFLAVLFWSDWNFILLGIKDAMKAVGEPYDDMLRVIMIVSASILFFLVTIYIGVAACFAKCCKTRVASVMAFIAVWSHVIGFALINNIAHVQDYYVYLATNTTVDTGHATPLGSPAVPPKGQVILTSLVVWILCGLGATLMLFCVQRLVMAFIITPHFEHIDEEISEEDEAFFVDHPFHAITEHVEEFTSEALALGTSYTLMRVICAGITGLLPAVMATSAKVKSSAEQAILWTIAVIFGFVAGSYVSCLDRIQKSGRQIRRIKLLQVALMYIQQFLTFLTAFTMLQAIRWNMYSAVAVRHSLFWHLIAGLVVSFFGLGLDCTFRCPCCSYKFEKEIMTILAILAAFTWELSFDLMLEQVRDLGKGSKNPVGIWLVDVIGSSLFTMLLPMFVFGIYPADKFHKAYLKKRKNELHEADDDESPYTDIGTDEYATENEAED